MRRLLGDMRRSGYERHLRMPIMLSSIEAKPQRTKRYEMSAADVVAYRAFSDFSMLHGVTGLGDNVGPS
jgi:hypothetical protein